MANKREESKWDPVIKKQAIDDACDLIIDRTRDGFLHKNLDWVRAWYTYELRWSEGKHRYITIPDSHISDFFEEAKRVAEVFELALLFVGSRLRSNRPIPLPFRKLVGDYLAGDWKPRQLKVGRPRNWGRDFILVEVMIRILDDYGTKPTRTTRQPRDPTKTKIVTKARVAAASEILFEAMQRSCVVEAGFEKMSLKRIQDIWFDKKTRSDYGKVRGLQILAMLDEFDEVSRN